MKVGLSRRLEAPVFFTSAAKVKIPFVGDDTRGVELVDTRYYPISNPLEKHHHEVSKHFVRMVSHDVRFDDNVVHERCAHSMPYKSQDFTNLYQPSFTTGSKPKRGESFSGRFDTVGYNRKVPGQFKKLKYPKVFKERKEEKSTHSALTNEDSKTDSSEMTLKTTKKTENISKKAMTYMSDAPTGTVKDWDQAMLEKLSKDTAHWIVHEGDLAGNQKLKLDQFLREKYGDNVSNTHIVRPDISESDLHKKNELMEEKRLKIAERLQQQERKKNAMRTHKTYKKSLAEYYKLPRYLSRQQTYVLTSKSEVNQSAQSIVVKHLEPSPPPKMEDFLVGVAGQFIKSTENEFEQRLYTEQAKPVHQVTNDKSRVVMDDLTEYKVDMRPQYPLHAKSWTGQDRENKSRDSDRNHRTFTKGIQRWASLPRPADFMSERGLNPPRSAEVNIERISYDKVESVVDNRPLVTLVEEWRSKWRLVGQWQDIPISEILIDMDSLHDNIRLGAVAACAMASLHKKPINELAAITVVSSLQFTGKEKQQSNTTGHLPDVLLTKVRKKLDDTNDRVKLAAAVCLYSLNMTDDKIFQILKLHMNSGYSCDRLAAAQCLALSNDISADVIRVIVQLLLEDSDSAPTKLYASQKEQATMLLVHLSKSTNLVHSLLAEQLNSSRWRDRITACQVIAKLAGNINKDMVHKLTNLMWDDWSSEVRKVAAETLGHTGHGRDIHYELKTKLSNGNEAVRINVLKKLSHLGIMTASLLPTFMKCFTDEYVSVRIQACKTTGTLQLSGDQIGKELLNLMEFDPSWKVKAHAIMAMKEIEFFTHKSAKALVWALRFEDEPEVRTQACLALRVHFEREEPDYATLDVLQDRALVEPDPSVREEVQNTLKSLDAASQGDNIEMIRQIKSEVRRLCHKGVIAAKIATYEKELDRYQNKVHYMGANLSEDTQSPNSSHPGSPIDMLRLLSPRFGTPRPFVSKTRHRATSGMNK